MKKIIILMAALMMSTAMFAQKFASVDSQECLALQDDYKQAQLDLYKAQADNQEVLNSMITDAQSKYQAYQQKAATWTPAVREAKEKELSDIQQRIEEFQQTSQQELQQIQQNLVAPIYEKVQNAISKVAKAGNYALVLDKNSALYIDPAQVTDITSAVRKELGIPSARTLEGFSQEVQAAIQAQMGQ